MLSELVTPEVLHDDEKEEKKEKKDEKKGEKKKSVAFKATSSKGKAKQGNQVKMKAHFLGMMKTMRRWLSL